MAQVYRTVNTTTGLDVVLKVPHASIAGDLTAFNRCHREIDIAARLDHPGLQHLLSEPNAAFMVFEYIDGESLRASCARASTTSRSSRSREPLRGRWNRLRAA
jgi:serine/threonine-protein kinase